jgi:hypothetical protein
MSLFLLASRRLALLCLSGGLLLAGPAFAQDEDPGSTGPQPGAPVPPPTGVPIDGGASLLLAGGVAYGLKKLRRRRAR